MNYKQQKEVITILNTVLPYIKQVHDDAELQYDSYGDYYMDSSRYEIMQETETLTNRIISMISIISNLKE